MCPEGDLCFCDEATFHVCGTYNRHICHVWGSEILVILLIMSVIHGRSVCGAL